MNSGGIMKKVIIGSLLIFGLAAGVSYGHGNGYFKGNGSHMMGSGNYMGRGHHGMSNHGGMGYGGCQGAWWNKDSGGNEQQQEFLNATSTLRRQMHEKMFDLKEASRNPNTPPTQLAELEKEIIDLRTEIQEQARKLDLIN